MTPLRYTLIGKVIALIVLAFAAITSLLPALTIRSVTVTGANPLSAMFSTLTPGAATITANGISTQALTVTEQGPEGIRQSSGGAMVTITRSGGTGSISAVTDNHDGTYTALVTAPVATGRGIFVATLGGDAVKSGTGLQTEATVTYAAGVATQTALNGGDAQSAVAGSAVGIAPSVIVKDANNNPVSGVSVTFAAATGGGSVTGGSATTNASGIATADGWTLGPTAGTNTLTATSGTLTNSPITFTATGTVGAATKVLMQTEPVGGASGAVLATRPAVKITDANGNTVTSGTASMSVTIASGTGGTLGGTTTVSAVNGVATFTNLALAGTVGTNYTLQFASSGLTSAMSAIVQVLSGPLAIGDNYCGGIIAYILVSGDPGYVAGQTHGLIAAPGDQSTGSLWWNGSYITTGATGTAIGTGAANTTAIVATQGAGSYAAKLCDDLVLNGYSDWYLPSRDELNKLYLNKRAVGGFETYFYWSSSEDNAYYAWYQYFGVGSQYFDIKFNYFHVRAVRAF
jgi:Protein of unknown function (DUF1566)/Invasin, domain 3